MSGISLEAILDVREWSGVPLGCPGVFGRPSQMSGRPSRMVGSGREALLYVRERLGVPPGYPRVVERSSEMSGSVQETLPYVW